MCRLQLLLHRIWKRCGIQGLVVYNDYIGGHYLLVLVQIKQIDTKTDQGNNQNADDEVSPLLGFGNFLRLRCIAFFQKIFCNFVRLSELGFQILLREVRM